MPKLKIITAAILYALGSNVHAELLPYSVSLKYLKNRPTIESVLIEQDGMKFIPKHDFEILYGKRISIPTIILDDVEYLPLEKLGSLEANDETLTATLSLFPRYMPEQKYSITAKRFLDERKPEAGQYTNYDLSAETATKFKSIDLSHQIATTKGNNGQLSVNWNTSKGLSLVNANFNIRDEEKKRMYRLGTGYSSSSNLSNSVRFAGFQVQSDYELENTYSDRVTTDFKGTAEVEGTAELFLNGNKIMSQDIRPGDFIFDGLYNPMTTTGEAQLLVRDINGRVVSIDKPLIGSPRNLKEGFTTYSFEAGLLRTNYNRLGDVFASGSYSYGYSDRLTLSSHFEATEEIQNISVSATQATPFGTVKAGASVGNGKAYNLGYFMSARSIFANLDYTKYDQYEGIAAGRERTGDKFTMSASYRLNTQRSISLTAIKAGDERLASIGTSWTMANRMRLQTTLSHDKNRGLSLFFGLDMPIGKMTSYSSYSSENKRLSSEFYSRSNNLNELDYRVRVDSIKGTQSVSGNLNLPTQNGDFGGSVSQTDKTNFRLHGSGAIVQTKKGISLSRKISDSYVILDTKTPNINIKTNSGYRGKTDSNGILVYPTSSNGKNTIFLDTQEFGDEATPAEATLTASAYPKSPVSVEVKILQPGFFLSLDTKKSKIVINGQEYFRTNEGFYIDGLSDGEHKFLVDGQTYIFNTDDVNAGNTIIAIKVNDI